MHVHSVYSVDLTHAPSNFLAAFSVHTAERVFATADIPRYWFLILFVK